MYFTYEKDGVIFAYYYEPPKSPTDNPFIETPLSELEGPFFPSFLALSIQGHIPDELNNFFASYQKIEKHLKSLLNQPNSNRVEISQLESQLSKLAGESIKQTKVVLKALISEKLLYQYVSTKEGEYIQFTALKIDSENSKKYYGSLAAEIAVKSEQISLLTSHGQTAGNYRELILRSLLEKYLPSRFGVGTGFIEGVPKQLDIIIYDKINFPVVFQEGDLVVVHKEAVRGIIEVKTTLDSQKLKESLQAFYDIFRAGLFKPILPIFKGVYSFESNYKNTSGLAKSIKNFYTKPYFEKSLQCDIKNEIQYLYHEITCICSLSKHFLFSKYSKHNAGKCNNILPTLYSITDENGLDIQTAAFIALIFDFLDGDFYSKRTAKKGFNNLLSADTVRIHMEEYLAESDWTPRTSSNGEHNFNQDSIAKRLDKLSMWFKGEISSSDYIREMESEKYDNALQPTQLRSAPHGS